MEAYTLTEKEAEALRKKEIALRHFYNPVKDKNDAFFISVFEFAKAEKLTEKELENLKLKQPKTIEIKPFDIGGKTIVVELDKPIKK